MAGNHAVAAGGGDLLGQRGLVRRGEEEAADVVCAAICTARLRPFGKCGKTGLEHELLSNKRRFFSRYY